MLGLLVGLDGEASAEGTGKGGGALPRSLGKSTMPASPSFGKGRTRCTLEAHPTSRMAKKRSGNLKTLAAALFTGVLVELSLVELALATTAGQALIRGVVFAGVTVFGYLIVRSVADEVGRRERTEFLAADLAEANRKLAGLNETKSTFVSFASHQLRAPIGGVRGYLLLLREGDFGRLPARAAGVVDSCVDQLDHLLHIVDMFLDVTRMEAGRDGLARAATDLRPLARAAVKDNAYFARSKRLALSLTLPPAPVKLAVDGAKLREVMFNLVENALKYTKEGSVSVSLAREDGHARFAVTDTGMGIPPDQVPTLFAKFVRGGAFRVSNGSGLGLYIAKTIVEAHGGTVFAESPGEGLGSTIGFRLPVRPAGLPAPKARRRHKPTR